MAVKPTTLLTLAQARDACLDDATNATKDDLVSLAADAASERIERDTSRAFKRRTRTEFHNGDGVGRVVYLRRFPVIAVSEFTVDGVAVDATAYVVNADDGVVLLKDGRTFPAGEQNIAITYDVGYDDANLPSDVVELAWQLTKRLYRMRKHGGSSFEQVSIGGNTFAVRDRLPDDMMKAIAALRDKRFG